MLVANFSGSTKIIRDHKPRNKTIKKKAQIWNDKITWVRLVCINFIMTTYKIENNIPWKVKYLFCFCCKQGVV